MARSPASPEGGADPLRAVEADESKSPIGRRRHAVEGGLQPGEAGDPLVDQDEADDDEERPEMSPTRPTRAPGTPRTRWPM